MKGSGPEERKVSASKSGIQAKPLTNTVLCDEKKNVLCPKIFIRTSQTKVLNRLTVVWQSKARSNQYVLLESTFYFLCNLVGQ